MTPPLGEWRNWQTRRIQVPVSERTWGFNSPLAHDPLLLRDRGDDLLAEVAGGERRLLRDRPILPGIGQPGRAVGAVGFGEDPATVFHFPCWRCCTLTGTFDPHFENPSVTSTVPRAFLPFRVSDMWRAWSTTKSLELVSVPREDVTTMGPVLAPAGTVAVIWVSESP